MLEGKIQLGLWLWHLAEGLRGSMGKPATSGGVKGESMCAYVCGVEVRQVRRVNVFEIWRHASQKTRSKKAKCKNEKHSKELRL